MKCPGSASIQCSVGRAVSLICRYPSKDLELVNSFRLNSQTDHVPTPKHHLLPLLFYSDTAFLMVEGLTHTLDRGTLNFLAHPMSCPLWKIWPLIHICKQRILNWGITNDWEAPKKCSTSLVIRKTQIKTYLRFHLTPVRMAKIKNSGESRYWQGCR